MLHEVAKLLLLRKVPVLHVVTKKIQPEVLVVLHPPQSRGFGLAGRLLGRSGFGLLEPWKASGGTEAAELFKPSYLSACFDPCTPLSTALLRHRRRSPIDNIIGIVDLGPRNPAARGRAWEARILKNARSMHHAPLRWLMGKQRPQGRHFTVYLWARLMKQIKQVLSIRRDAISSFRTNLASLRNNERRNV